MNRDMDLLGLTIRLMKNDLPEEAAGIHHVRNRPQIKGQKPLSTFWGDAL